MSSFTDWVKRNASWTGLRNIGREASWLFPTQAGSNVVSGLSASAMRGNLDPWRSTVQNATTSFLPKTVLPQYQRNVVEPGARVIVDPMRGIFDPNYRSMLNSGSTWDQIKRGANPWNRERVDAYNSWNAPSYHMGWMPSWSPVKQLGVKGLAEVAGDPLTYLSAGTAGGMAEGALKTGAEAAAKRGATRTAGALGKAAGVAEKASLVGKAIENPIESLRYGPAKAAEMGLARQGERDLARWTANQVKAGAINPYRALPNPYKAPAKAATEIAGEATPHTMNGIPEGLDVKLSNAADDAVPHTVNALPEASVVERAWPKLTAGQRAGLAHMAGVPDPFQAAEKEWKELGEAATAIQGQTLPKEWMPKPEMPGRVNVKMGDVPEYKPVMQGVSQTGPLPEMTGQNLDDKLLATLKDRKVMIDEQEAARHLERQKRVSAAQRAGEGKVGVERQIAEKTELKGGMPRSEVEPLAPAFSPNERAELTRRIDNVYQTEQVLYERVNAKDALDRLMDHGVLPTDYEMGLFRDVYGDNFVQMLYRKAVESEWKRASLFGKAGILGRGLAGDVRVMETIMDMSAPLRQGIINSVTHPISSSKAMVKAVQAMGDKNVAQKIVESFNLHEDAAILKFAQRKKMNSPFVAIEGGFKRSEELYSQGLLTEILPGVKQVKHLSERHYATFLNIQRHDLYYGMVNSWKKMYPDIADAIKKTGDLDAEIFYKDAKATTRTAKALKQLDELGDWVNITTGRGDLPKFLEKHAETLNVVLYASRLMASRLEYVPKGLVYSITNPVIRKEFAKELVALTTFSISVLVAAKAAGANVETDPRSADFGKIRVGNTRIEFMGGFQPYIRYTAQLITGQTKSNGQIRQKSRGDTLARFLRSKESPVAGLVHDIWSGETFVGEPMDLSGETVARTAYQKLVPLFAQDVVDAVGQEGPEGAALASPGFFGAGITSYGEKPAATTVAQPIMVSPAQRIENMAWMAYPYERRISQQIDLLSETDPAAAKRLLARYPQIVQIRKQVALRKKQLKGI